MSNTTSTVTRLHIQRDGRILRIVRRRHIGADGHLLLDFQKSGGGWPLEDLLVMLTELQALADEDGISFCQAFEFPDGISIRFSFKPGVPPTSVSMDDPPHRHAPGFRR